MKLKKTEFRTAHVGPYTGIDKDMLRYDGAFVSDLYPETVAFPTWKTKYGDLYGKITVGRWSSFGIKKLEPLNVSTAEDLRRDMMQFPSQWVTYRQATSQNEPKLVRFTFEDFLKAKDLDEIRTEEQIRAGFSRCERCGYTEAHSLACPKNLANKR